MNTIIKHPCVAPLAMLAVAAVALLSLSTVARAVSVTPDNPSVADPAAPGLIGELLADPAVKIEEIVCVALPHNSSMHAYDTFGYRANLPKQVPTTAADLVGGVAGSRLLRVNLRSGRTTSILEDAGGAIRDPCVHYDGRTILFSYRKAGSMSYHLYQIQADGTGLRQLTDGIYDDIEPCYLPDGGVVFVSSRSQRWVPCFSTQCGNIFRCDGDGRNIVRLSANVDHDLLPWVFPDGRIVYTRWEYVDFNHERLKRARYDGAPERREDFSNDDSLIDLTEPEMSLILMAPLAKEAGGLGWCRAKDEMPAAVFTTIGDPDYRRILSLIDRELNSFEVPGFKPHPAYFREMIRYGILPPAFNPLTDPYDVYELDRRYYQQQAPSGTHEQVQND